MSFGRNLNHELGTKEFRDTEAYQHVGKKCFACREIITKRDVTKPRAVYVQQADSNYVMHDTCLQDLQKRHGGGIQTIEKGELE